MNSNFTPDQTLVDKIQFNDTAAFEELYHRYCYLLYAYCNGKLHSAEDARSIVRNIFVSLWKNRNSLPVDFSISLHLYLEVRKAVVKCVNEKLIYQTDISTVENKIIPGFTITSLKQAKEPAKPYNKAVTEMNPVVNRQRKTQEQWWGQYFASLNLKNVRYALQRVTNLW